MNNGLKLLPSELKDCLLSLPEDMRNNIWELRLRVGKPMAVTTDRGSMNGLSSPVRPEQLRRVLELATGASPYAAEESLRRGYFTAEGGIRIGICGAGGEMTPGLRSALMISSLNIRLPSEVTGCADSLCPEPFPSTLILSPPGGGKTTLLRDMIRQLSNRGMRVGVCDERGEIGAFSGQSMGFDLGDNTDVITGCSREEAAIRLLRTMNPQIIAMDEISGAEDAAVCQNAMSSGSAVLATAHGERVSSLTGKEGFADLLNGTGFERIIHIRRKIERREYREEWYGVDGWGPHC